MAKSKDRSTLKTILEGKVEQNRARDRQRCRWEDNMSVDRIQPGWMRHQGQGMGETGDALPPTFTLGQWSHHDDDDNRTNTAVLFWNLKNQHTDDKEIGSNNDVVLEKNATKNPDHTKGKQRSSRKFLNEENYLNLCKKKKKKLKLLGHVMTRHIRDLSNVWKVKGKGGRP